MLKLIFGAHVLTMASQISPYHFNQAQRDYSFHEDHNLQVLQNLKNHSKGSSSCCYFSDMITVSLITERVSKFTGEEKEDESIAFENCTSSHTIP